MRLLFRTLFLFLLGTLFLFAFAGLPIWGEEISPGRGAVLTIIYLFGLAVPIGYFVETGKF